MHEDIESRVVLGVVAGGRCYGNYDQRHSSCCRCPISQFCAPATRRRAQANLKPPKPPPPPPKPEVVELPPISPFAYFLESLHGKYDVCEFPVNDAIDGYDCKESEELVVRIYHVRDDGRMRVIKSSGSDEKWPPFESLSAVEEALRQL